MRVIVKGRVQGVSYRWFTVEEAERLGLTGWVRNLPDGSVELEAEGPEPQLEALVTWCRRGPPAARVTDVDVEWIAVIGGERGFDLRRS
jgi:acylphosphatase